jgi:predicted nucleic acid-binding protein
MLERGDLLLTGALTVGEVLVKPMEQKNARLAELYRAFFANQAVVTVVPGISHADAIQLACAAAADTDLFITNDARLEKKTIRGIKFVTSLARAPL